MEVEPASDDWGYELVTHRIVPPTMCDSKGVIDMADETGGIKEIEARIISTSSAPKRSFAREEQEIIKERINLY